MGYSIIPILHPHEDKSGLRKIHIRFIYDRIIVYAPTKHKVAASQFNGWVTNHPQKTDINNLLKGQISQITARLHQALKFKESFTKPELDLIAKGTTKDSLKSFIEKLIADKVAKEGTLRQYKANMAKIEEYHPNVKLTDITTTWLKNYEVYLRTGKRKNSDNTINTNMKRLTGILNKAADLGRVDPKAYEGYSPPPYLDQIPEYLEQHEVDAFIEKLPEFPPSQQMAGYYFLLGCRAGFRISDLKTFTADRVKGGRLVLRAKKNGKIVSIPIYPQLQMVLDYVIANPFNMAEETMRRYVKEICRAAGIKRNIKVHTARHTFGMMLADNGFSIEDIAELLGDTPRVARIYARISNSRLDAKFKDRFTSEQ